MPSHFCICLKNDASSNECPSFERVSASSSLIRIMSCSSGVVWKFELQQFQNVGVRAFARLILCVVLASVIIALPSGVKIGSAFRTYVFVRQCPAKWCKRNWVNHSLHGSPFPKANQRFVWGAKPAPHTRTLCDRTFTVIFDVLR